ncbi:MAG TPA: MauE/DoxX family redox-associated membrane protein [Candidatus Limnocylindrales bacterium]
MLALLGVTIRFAAAVLLLYAAARKFASPAPFRRTLDELRVPGARALGPAVASAEIVAAMGLVAAPRSAFTAILVVGLGFCFAGAALVALVRGQRIHCACYGGASKSGATLGIRQLVALPVWVAVAGIAMLAPDGGISGPRFIPALGAGLAVAVTGFALVPRALRNRSYLKVLETK